MWQSEVAAGTNRPGRPVAPAAFWSCEAEALFTALESGPGGLSDAEAARRLVRYGPNVLRPRREWGPLGLLLRQFASPLVLILVLAAVLSLGTGSWPDAVIILAIVLVSTLLGFTQEYRASAAVEALRRQTTLTSTVVRDGTPRTVPTDQIVPGDVILLSAGSLTPADGRVLEARDLFLSQSALTGETFPAEKEPGTVPATAGIAERTNCVFQGTSVRSGTARVVVVRTGEDTELGGVSTRLARGAPETEFERSIRDFSGMMTRVVALLVLVVFAINTILHRPPLESLLFAVALAVGMTPELLPAIISITLARGAQQMAAAGVITRRLAAIEDLGSMDVLCTDKTGTLTQGAVRLEEALAPDGRPDDAVFLWAHLNARFETGLANPLDQAILAAGTPPVGGWVKREEIPYDFQRRRLTVAVAEGPGSDPLLITKGALESILGICSHFRSGGSDSRLDEAGRRALLDRFARWSAQGFRVLGVATRRVPARPRYTSADESDMVFAGFLLFFDPPRPDAAATLRDLRALGVEVKIITGDSRRVAVHVANQVGLDSTGAVTGAELAVLPSEALGHLVERADIFAEVDPGQKERIIAALRGRGRVVGYLGDGINDAPALHAADVGISVDTAVDVARETADFVLRDAGLDVLRRGIQEGRATLANSLKYVFTTTSANFGNMVSMAGLSLFLPYLPLLPKQILLNNFLSDVPAMALPGDAVDPQWAGRPRRWNVGFIRSFMVTFGLISSLFDFLTFGVLLWVLRCSQTEFRSGWFVESLLTEVVILLVVRTHLPVWRSRPGRWLAWSSAAAAAAGLALPYLPIGTQWFELTPLEPLTLALLIGITLLYALASEAAKRRFFRRAGV